MRDAHPCQRDYRPTSRTARRLPGCGNPRPLRMKIALGIATASDLGGLQRDCLELADALQARGHEVEIFAARCVAPWTASRSVRMLPARGVTNHGLDLAFGQALQNAVRSRFDMVIGFNKLPGLDVYYCADPSIAAKPEPAWKRALPRHRARLALERACFDPSSTTSALMLSRDVLESYRKAWRTPDDRLFLLPPRIARDSVRAELRAPALRREARAARGYGERETVWLWVAAQPVTKGLDRVLAALAHRPRARLLALGLAPDEAKGRRYRQRAERSQVSHSIQWVKYSDRVPELMAVADVLVHPARLDVTGQVILEAIANGLPVVASAVCGFAHHIQTAGAGAVIAEPFDQRAFDEALKLAENPAVRARWSAAALAYTSLHDFARGQEAAVEIVERIGEAGRRRA
jgi:UDP-glucose:(heptosyl)LPS alpha-1,3-glucosyltransferase